MDESQIEALYYLVRLTASVLQLDKSSQLIRISSLIDSRLKTITGQTQLIDFFNKTADIKVDENVDLEIQATRLSLCSPEEKLMIYQLICLLFAEAKITDFSQDRFLGRLGIALILPPEAIIQIHSSMIEIISKEIVTDEKSHSTGHI